MLSPKVLMLPSRNIGSMKTLLWSFLSVILVAKCRSNKAPGIEKCCVDADSETSNAISPGATTDLYGLCTFATFYKKDLLKVDLSAL